MDTPSVAFIGGGRITRIILNPDVMNLIPVKPLAEEENTIREMYRTKLPGLYQIIKP